MEEIRKNKAEAEQDYRNSMPASSYQQQKLRVCEVIVHCSSYKLSNCDVASYICIQNQLVQNVILFGNVCCLFFVFVSQIQIVTQNDISIKYATNH